MEREPHYVVATFILLSFLGVFAYGCALPALKSTDGTCRFTYKGIVDARVPA